MHHASEAAVLAVETAVTVTAGALALRSAIRIRRRGRLAEEDFPDAILAPAIAVAAWYAAEGPPGPLKTAAVTALATAVLLETAASIIKRIGGEDKRKKDDN